MSGVRSATTEAVARLRAIAATMEVGDSITFDVAIPPEPKGDVYEGVIAAVRTLATRGLTLHTSSDPDEIGRKWWCEKLREEDAAEMRARGVLP